MNKRTLILPSVAIVALAGTLFLSNQHVYAQDPTEQYAPIVQKIAEKFKLNATDVKAIFDAERQERINQMESKFEAMLEDDVRSGKINSNQKQAIITKHKELSASRQNFADWKNLTTEQRKAKMLQKRQNLQNWATQNGIDLKYLLGGFGIRGGHWKMLPWEK